MQSASMPPPTGAPGAGPLDNTPGYEVRFRSLFHAGRAVSFPCDAEGHVQLDGLSERARLAYLHARAMVGREYEAPAVLLSALPAR